MSSCETSLDAHCEGATGKMCFCCGLPTCGACSKKVEYHGYGIKRLCANCLKEYADTLAKV